MSKKMAQLLQESLSKRWSATSAPAVGATCVASSPSVTNGVQNLTTLNVSVKNQTAAAITSTFSVRDNSIAGTVLASLDFVVAAGGGVVQSCYFDLSGNESNAIYVEGGTPAGSVTQKATICGWQESFR